MSYGTRPYGIQPYGTRGGSADVTVAITGQTATYTQGNLGTSHSVPLSGQSATYAQGTLGTASSSTVSLTGQSATYTQGTLTPSTGGGTTPDTHDGDTWRDYRRGIRKLAELAEERRRAKVEEAREIRQEILAALGDAKPLDGTEIKSAVRAVASAVPGPDPEKVTEAQLSRVTDWAPIYDAVAELRRAIEYERMLEQDDEEVLLLL